MIWGAGVRFEVTGSPVADGLVSLVWMIVVTNAFNLLDNMDGLCGGTAAVALMGLAGVALASGQVALAVTALAITGGCLGFLCFNWRPSTIFMGDAGSMFLGASVGAARVGGSSSGSAVGSDRRPASHNRTTCRRHCHCGVRASAAPRHLGDAGRAATTCRTDWWNSVCGGGPRSVCLSVSRRSASASPSRRHEDWSTLGWHSSWPRFRLPPCGFGRPDPGYTTTLSWASSGGWMGDTCWWSARVRRFSACCACDGGGLGRRCRWVRLEYRRGFSMSSPVIRWRLGRTSIKRQHPSRAPDNACELSG